MDKETNSVQSVERTFLIIEELSGASAGLPLTELSKRVGLHKSTVHRLLSSLSAMGYVSKDSFTGNYRLSLRLFEISSRIVNDLDILEISKPYLDRLSILTSEAVHLVVRDGINIIYIYKADFNNNIVRMSSRIGLRSNMHCTAVGKSILATLGTDEVAQIWNGTEIKRFTEHSITSLDELLGQLSDIRRLGFALDNEENELGVRCVAASIVDYSGVAVGAFSVSAPTTRMDEDRIRELSGYVLETREKISREYGGK